MSARGTLIDTSKVKRDDLIYLAGLIDGDGCFFISKRITRGNRKCQSYAMNLNIHCVEKSLIDWIIDTFGGIRYINRKKPPRRPLHGVEFTGNRLTQLISLILPFLKLKKPHAQNMLEMRSTYDGIGGRYTNIPKEIIDLRDQCYLKSREMNSHKPLPKI